jgi:hypothetical protein
MLTTDRLACHAVTYDSDSAVTDNCLFYGITDTTLFDYTTKPDSTITLVINQYTCADNAIACEF